MVDGEERAGKASAPADDAERNVLGEHIIHLRRVHFTLLIACIVILVAVYLSLQERRVSAAADQLESFVSAFSPESSDGWESALHDLAWQSFESPTQSSAPSLEVPQNTTFTAWLPAFRIETKPGADDLIKVVEEKRLLAGRGGYLEFVLDLVLLGLPNRSVILSNPALRKSSDCLGKLQSETPRRVRELRQFWQSLRNLQAVTFTNSRLEGTFQLFVDLIDGRGKFSRAHEIYQGPIVLREKLDTAVDAFLSDALEVDFVRMQPCIVEAGSAVSNVLLRERIGLVGVQRSLVYFVGEMRLSPLLVDRTPLSLRFLLIPEGMNVRVFDGRRAMTDLLGGRPGDGSFTAAFPELASVGQREVLIDERAKALAEEDAELSAERGGLSGLELLHFDILNTDVPLPPRPEERIDLFGAKIQVEDVVLWGGIALLGVQFYFMMHLNGFLDLLKGAQGGVLRAPWIGVYRSVVSCVATLVTTSLVPFSICAYLAYRIAGREQEFTFVIVTLVVAALSLLVAFLTTQTFLKIWTIYEAD